MFKHLKYIDVYTVYFCENKIYFKGVIKAGLSLFSASENKFRRGKNDLVAAGLALTIFGNAVNLMVNAIG